VKLKIIDRRPERDLIIVEVGDIRLVFSHLAGKKGDWEPRSALSIEREHSPALDREDLFYAELTGYDIEGENLGRGYEFDVNELSYEQRKNREEWLAISTSPDDQLVVDALHHFGVDSGVFRWWDGVRRATYLADKIRPVEMNDLLFKDALKHLSPERARRAKIWLYIAIHPDEEVRNVLRMAMEGLALDWRNFRPHEQAMRCSCSVDPAAHLSETLWKEASEFANVYGWEDAQPPDQPPED
jgi:hypothetical protein